MLKNVCKDCHVAFDKRLTKCPICGKKVIDDNKTSYLDQEGNGRKYGAGGNACDYCPQCYGCGDWCPFLD